MSLWWAVVNEISCCSIWSNCCNVGTECKWWAVEVSIMNIFPIHMPRIPGCALLLNYKIWVLQNCQIMGIIPEDTAELPIVNGLSVWARCSKWLLGVFLICIHFLLWQICGPCWVQVAGHLHCGWEAFAYCRLNTHFRMTKVLWGEIAPQSTIESDKIMEGLDIHVVCSPVCL